MNMEDEPHTSRSSTAVIDAKIGKEELLKEGQRLSLQDLFFP
jgi:hypothetical protein